MNDQKRMPEVWLGSSGAGIFNALFSLIVGSDPYGPERALEWAQSLVDDPDLLMACAEHPEAEITVRQLRLSTPSRTGEGLAIASRGWN